MLHRGLESWGRNIHRLRWAIIVIWIAIIVASGWLSLRYSDVLSGGGWDIAGSDSQQVKELLSHEFDGRSASSLLLVYRDEAMAATDSDYTVKLEQLIDFLAQEEGIENFYSMLNAADAIKPGMVGRDGHTTYAFVNMSVEEDYATNLMPGIQERYVAYAETLGVESYLIGGAALWGDISVYSKEGLIRAEMIVFPLMFIILLFVFRSVLATITPIIVTVAAVIAGMGLIYLTGSRVEMSVFVTNSALMLGIGLGIDYSLFMVNRFRNELEAGRSKIEAMAVSMRTAGHTILFSGITVLAAMLALFVVKLPAIKAIAFGAVAVVIFAVLATLSLLPAVLTMLGHRINKGRIPSLFRSNGRSVSIWVSIARTIMKRPVIFLVLTVALMGVFALPAMDMKLNTNDVSILPADSNVRKGFDLYESAFSDGGSSTTTLVVAVDEGHVMDERNVPFIRELELRLGSLEHVTRLSSALSFAQGMEAAHASAFLTGDPAGWPPGLEPMIDRYISRDGLLAVIDITIGADGASDVSQNLVRHLRDELLPELDVPGQLSLVLGGDTVMGMDMNQAIYDAIVPTILIMLASIYVILLVTFRSVLLPLKAILMNIISVCATFGVVTWVFAQGHGIELFGATANGYISNFIPLLMLALLFGLSTDYEVFLISRVKEHYDETGRNEESVVVGLEKTGPLITGAALLMIAVFTGFAFSSMLPIQMLGFGMAVAIFLDATIVRMMIVPAAMKLLGKWNWWFPGSKSKHTPN